MTFTNKTNVSIQDFEIQFNKNYFGLSANANNIKGMILRPGTNEEKKVELLTNVSADNTKIPNYDPPFILQTAIRCTLDEFYFTVPVMVSVIFENLIEKMGPEEYQKSWVNIQTTKDMCITLNGIHPRYQNPEQVI